MCRCHTVPVATKHTPDIYKNAHSFFIFCRFLTTANLQSHYAWWGKNMSFASFEFAGHSVCSLNAPLLLHEQWCSLCIISRSFIILQTCTVSLLNILLSRVNDSNLFNFSGIWIFFWALAHSYHSSTNSFSSAISAQRSSGQYHIPDSGEFLSIALETGIFSVLFFISAASKMFSGCPSFSAMMHGNFLH